MDEGERRALEPYIALIGDFVGGRMTAEEFEETYEDRYRADPQRWSEPTFQVLDRLFADVDFFVADDDLREPEKGDLDPVGLAQAARSALDALTAM